MYVGINNALPRRAIPEEFTKDLRKKVTHITFASNPCRIRFFTQEIVFFREDLLRKMQRHTVLPPRYTYISMFTHTYPCDFTQPCVSIYAVIMIITCIDHKKVFIRKT
jgi:hypothetical protein